MNNTFSNLCFIAVSVNTKNLNKIVNNDDGDGDKPEMSYHRQVSFQTNILRGRLDGWGGGGKKNEVSSRYQKIGGWNRKMLKGKGV